MQIQRVFVPNQSRKDNGHFFDKKMHVKLPPAHVVGPESGLHELHAECPGIPLTVFRNFAFESAPIEAKLCSKIVLALLHFMRLIAKQRPFVTAQRMVSVRLFEVA